MSLIRYASKYRLGGFTDDPDDAMIYHETYDCHRLSKTAEGSRVAFSNRIPYKFVDHALKWLASIGAPVSGMEFAYTSKTVQSDRKYVLDSIRSGLPMRRNVYSRTNLHSDKLPHGTCVSNIVDSYSGHYPLSPALMGPLSRARLIFSMSDAQWKDMTRRGPLIDYLNNMHIPHSLRDGSVYVNNVSVNVSGHVLQYIINTSLLQTDLSMAFDLGTFRADYQRNILSPFMGDEPSFDSCAWHSWLETEVAVFGALRFIRLAVKSGVPLRRESVKLALMASVDVFRRNFRNKHTSVSIVRGGLRLYDTRFWTAQHNYRHRFVVMPMGTGKTSLADRYHPYFIDIDDAEREGGWKSKRKGMLRLAVESGDWSAYNSYYYKRCYEWIEGMIDRYGHAIFLIHNPDLVARLFPNAPVIVIRLPRALTIRSVVARDGEESRRLAEMNWDSLSKDFSSLPQLKYFEVADRSRLEEIIIYWVNQHPQERWRSHPCERVPVR